jgi:hypothetical protein
LFVGAGRYHYIRNDLFSFFLCCFDGFVGSLLDLCNLGIFLLPRAGVKRLELLAGPFTCVELGAELPLLSSRFLPLGLGIEFHLLNDGHLRGDGFINCLLDGVVLLLLVLLLYVCASCLRHLERLLGPHKLALDVSRFAAICLNTSSLPQSSRRRFSSSLGRALVSASSSNALDLRCLKSRASALGFDLMDSCLRS